MGREIQDTVIRWIMPLLYETTPLADGNVDWSKTKVEISSADRLNWTSYLPYGKEKKENTWLGTYWETEIEKKQGGMEVSCLPGKTI